jgi:hypothetical protein
VLCLEHGLNLCFLSVREIEQRGEMIHPLCRALVPATGARSPGVNRLLRSGQRDNSLEAPHG